MLVFSLFPVDFNEEFSHLDVISPKTRPVSFSAWAYVGDFFGLSRLVPSVRASGLRAVVL